MIHCVMGKAGGGEGERNGGGDGRSCLLALLLEGGLVIWYDSTVIPRGVHYEILRFQAWNDSMVCTLTM